jgi:hypothetical protein
VKRAGVAFEVVEKMFENEHEKTKKAMNLVLLVFSAAVAVNPDGDPVAPAVGSLSNIGTVEFLTRGPLGDAAKRQTDETLSERVVNTLYSYFGTCADLLTRLDNAFDELEREFHDRTTTSSPDVLFLGGYEGPNETTRLLDAPLPDRFQVANIKRRRTPPSSRSSGSDFRSSSNHVHTQVIESSYPTDTDTRPPAGKTERVKSISRGFTDCNPVDPPTPAPPSMITQPYSFMSSPSEYLAVEYTTEPLTDPKHDWTTAARIPIPSLGSSATDEDIKVGRKPSAPFPLAKSEDSFVDLSSLVDSFEAEFESLTAEPIISTIKEDDYVIIF